ncbi:MAG: hypothetical protein HYY40_14500 [Bacteroidetes bacterium]|nr:hypothetical protein [Bacteroidota bacterium]
MIPSSQKTVFIDGSLLVTESLVRAGADVFIGYPITPANLLYLYSSRRFPTFIAAPDEITTLQLMSGYSAAGRIPVTATSFPGYALMLESINMAYMMELPMVVILVQRLGPATGTATGGAQGDLALLNGTISGGLTLPVVSISGPHDGWVLAAKAVEMAVQMRTPVILLTSKEEMMTMFSFDLNALEEIKPVTRKYFKGGDSYKPYLPDENLVPAFVPLTDKNHQVRLTASTHDTCGILQNTAKEALENSVRLHKKIIKNSSGYSFYDLEEEKGAGTLIVSWGITALAAKEAAGRIRKEGKKVSLLITKTLLPVPDVYYNIMARYKKVIIAEENLTGQYRQILFGSKSPDNITGVNKFGKMISPEEIMEKFEEIYYAPNACRQAGDKFSQIVPSA